MSSSSGQPANSRSQRELTGFTYNLVGHVKHQGLPVANLQIAVFDQYQLFEPGSEPLSVGMTGSRGEFSFAVRPGVYTLRTIPNVEAGTRFLSKSVEARDGFADSSRWRPTSSTTRTISEGKIGFVKNVVIPAEAASSLVSKVVSAVRRMIGVCAGLATPEKW